jgi:hypothetical protein
MIDKYFSAAVGGYQRIAKSRVIGMPQRVRFEVAELADAILDRAARRDRVGRLVRLELARPLVAAFGEIPILEFADEAGREHPRAERGRRRRNSVLKLLDGLFLSAALVIDHQVAAGRDDLAHDRDQLILDPIVTRPDRPAVDLNRRMEARLDPRLHTASARTHDRSHRGSAMMPRFSDGDSDADEEPSDAVAQRPDFIQRQTPVLVCAALESGGDCADEWISSVHGRTIASVRISDINISVF